jgi:hypothetical protein
MISSIYRENLGLATCLPYLFSDDGSPAAARFGPVAAQQVSPSWRYPESMLKIVAGLA